MRHSTLLVIENLENSVRVYILHTKILNSYIFDSAFEIHSEIINKTTWFQRSVYPKITSQM